MTRPSQVSRRSEGCRHACRSTPDDRHLSRPILMAIAVRLRSVLHDTQPANVPEDVLEKSGAKEARAKFAAIPVAQPAQLAEADGILFGTPTRFGNMCAQMRNFLDQTAPRQDLARRAHCHHMTTVPQLEDRHQLGRSHIRIPSLQSR